VIFLLIAGVLVAAFAAKANAAPPTPGLVTETLQQVPVTKTDFYPTSKDVRSVSQMVTEGGPLIFNPVAKGGGAPSSSAGVPPGAPGGAPSGAGGGGTGATGGRGVPNVY
jgi:hypothetical protein